MTNERPFNDAGEPTMTASQFRQACAIDEQDRHDDRCDDRHDDRCDDPDFTDHAEG